MTGEEFKRFHEANIARLNEVFSGLTSWTIDEWIACLAGEVGELINIAKKIKRFDSGMTDGKTREEILDAIGSELGDCVAYVSLISHADSSYPGQRDRDRLIRFDADPYKVTRRAFAIREQGFSSLLSLHRLVTRYWDSESGIGHILDEIEAIAEAYGIDLNAVTVRKFNEISVKRGSKIFL